MLITDCAVAGVSQTMNLFVAWIGLKEGGCCARQREVLSRPCLRCRQRRQRHRQKSRCAQIEAMRSAPVRVERGCSEMGKQTSTASALRFVPRVRRRQARGLALVAGARAPPAMSSFRYRHLVSIHCTLDRLWLSGAYGDTIHSATRIRGLQTSVITLPRLTAATATSRSDSRTILRPSIRHEHNSPTANGRALELRSHPPVTAE